MRHKRIITLISISLVIAIALLLWLPLRLSVETDNGVISISFETQVVLANPGWVSPTSDTANGWTDSGFAWDDNTATFAYHSTPAGWGPYLELHIAEIQCTKVQGWWGIINTQVTTVEVDVYFSGAYNNIYSGAIVTGSFQEYEIGSEQAVTAMRVRFYATKAARQAEVYEADFWEVGVAEPDIVNAPNTWVLNGIVNNGNIQTDTVYYANPQGDTQAPASTVADADCRFTITNSSTMAIDLTCTMGSFSGGDDNMTNSETGLNGATTYGAYSWFSGQLYANKVIIKSSGSSVGYDGLAALTDIKWGAEVETQTNPWTGGTPSIATLTITATVD